MTQPVAFGQCPGCCRYYNISSRVPKRLSCQHTLCSLCLETGWDSQACPECGKTVSKRRKRRPDDRTMLRYIATSSQTATTADDNSDPKVKLMNIVSSLSHVLTSLESSQPQNTSPMSLSQQFQASVELSTTRTQQPYRTQRRAASKLRQVFEEARKLLESRYPLRTAIVDRVLRQAESAVSSAGLAMWSTNLDRATHHTASTGSEHPAPHRQYRTGYPDNLLDTLPQSSQGVQGNLGQASLGESTTYVSHTESPLRQSSTGNSRPLSHLRQPGTGNSGPVPQSRQSGIQISRPVPQSRQTVPENSHPVPQSRQPGTGNSHPVPQSRQPSTGNSHPVPQSRQAGTGNSHPVPQSRQAGTGNSHPVPQSRQPGTGNSHPVAQSRQPGTRHSSFVPHPRPRNRQNVSTDTSAGYPPTSPNHIEHIQPRRTSDNHQTYGGGFGGYSASRDNQTVHNVRDDHFPTTLPTHHQHRNTMSVPSRPHTTPQTAPSMSPGRGLSGQAEVMVLGMRRVTSAHDPRQQRGDAAKQPSHCDTHTPPPPPPRTHFPAIHLSLPRRYRNPPETHPDWTLDLAQYQRRVRYDTAQHCLDSLARMKAVTETRQQPAHISRYITVYGKTGIRAGQFDVPCGVAASGYGHIFVADTRNQRLQILDQDGVFQTVVYNVAGRSLNLPTSVAVTRTGDIVLTDSGNQRVCVLDPTGRDKLVFGQRGGLLCPYGIAVSEQGMIAVSDLMLNQIQVYDPDGRLLSVQCSPGCRPRQLHQPRGLSYHTNQWYVADSGNNRIQVFSTTGKSVITIGSSGSNPGQLATPSAVTVDHQGVIYVCDGGNHRVQSMLDCRCCKPSDELDELLLFWHYSMCEGDSVFCAH